MGEERDPLMAELFFHPTSNVKVEVWSLAIGTLFGILQGVAQIGWQLS